MSRHLIRFGEVPFQLKTIRNPIVAEHRTESGDFVAALEMPRLGNTMEESQVVFVNVTTGTYGRLICSHCQAISSGPGSSIILMRLVVDIYAKALNNDNVGSELHRKPPQIMQVSLPVPTDPASRNFKDMPISPEYWKWPYILSATEDTVTTNEGDQYNKYRNQIFVRSKGTGTSATGTPLVSLDWDGFEISAASNPESGDLLLTAQSVTSHACGAGADSILISSDGKIHSIDALAAKPKDANWWDYDVIDTWWGLDGNFHASIVSWSCTRKDAGAYSYTSYRRSMEKISSLWRLDTNSIKWVEEDEYHGSVVRFTGDRSYIALNLPDCANRDFARYDQSMECRTGPLFKYGHDSRIKASDDVISISTAPRKAA